MATLKQLKQEQATRMQAYQDAIEDDLDSEEIYRALVKLDQAMRCLALARKKRYVHLMKFIIINPLMETEDWLLENLSELRAEDAMDSYYFYGFAGEIETSSRTQSRINAVYECQNDLSRYDGILRERVGHYRHVYSKSGHQSYNDLLDEQAIQSVDMSEWNDDLPF